MATPCLSFIPALCLTEVPLAIFRWVIAGVAGFMSATFVALNQRAHIMSAGEKVVLDRSRIFLLQLALSIVLKLLIVHELLYQKEIVSWFHKER
ncbi:hypothetical protein NC652_012810 [Populus alba x Populus x berolinensis]|nr:hypothetical protein NC652_012810 [Populus alba x Populus x berolinensis]